jgi:S1-C subfamily serine protease
MQVVPGGPADRAGIHGGNQQAWLGNTRILIGGDLIVAIDGAQVEDPQDLTQIMNNHRAGDTVKVTYMRGRKKVETTVTLGEARERV